MDKYVANEFLVHKGNIVPIGESVELTEEQAERLGKKVTKADEAAADPNVDYDKPLDEMDKKELQAEAKKLNVDGYSKMTKDELIDAIEEAESE